MISRNGSIRRQPALILLAMGLPLLSAAQPAGLKNFQQINGHIYRGAQPTAEGFRSYRNWAWRSSQACGRLGTIDAELGDALSTRR